MSIVDKLYHIIMILVMYTVPSITRNKNTEYHFLSFYILLCNEACTASAYFYLCISICP